ncbi:hypothetical protein RJ641_030669 [Dillenia turbinata]|uniref:Uncharacterized protein n=1 Tax=Dillenia turbinata TaxID=194707 RepID=A0AAN8VU78_9MAGN
MHNPRLEGKVAIITGAASGIGEATARLFAENGAFVVIADIQDELVEETVSRAVQQYGGLHIMYSNAGILGQSRSILEMDMVDFDHTMAVNGRGTALAIKHAARAMVANQTRGSIICTASLSSMLSGSGPHAYTASKHALLGLVKSASTELGKYGIRVNCISPFGVATGMTRKLVDDDSAEKTTASMAILKGIRLKAKHVAEAALYLGSDDSTFVTGHNLVVDGGVSITGSDSLSFFRQLFFGPASPTS